MEMHQYLACGLELKFDDSSTDAMTFTGYGAVFGNIDAYGDVIQKGAFKDTLREAKRSKIWPAMLSQHGGWGMSSEDLTPVGIWTDMEEDDVGLRVEGKLAETPRGRELYTLMKMTPRPAINGLSIGYRAKEFSLGTKPDEPRRTLKKIDLVEVSPVTFPANLKARVSGVKSIEQLSTLAEAERYLRDACGLSRAEAVTFVSRIKGLRPSDSDGQTEALRALIESRGFTPNR
jgi:HK97 family phage prohead protease